jgi:hypothetical protein
VDRTARLLSAKAATDRRAPVVVDGTLTGTRNGVLQVDVGGQTVPVPGDRRWPAPTPGPVTLLYADGQYRLFHAPL